MIKLTVDGRTYEGWISAQVKRSLDSFAHAFSLTYRDRWTDMQESWPIRGGAECQLFWDDELLITGYVDRPTWTVTGDTWDLRADGRSRTRNLVDSSAVHKTGFWRDVRAVDVIRDLCGPHDVEVRDEVRDTTLFARLAIKEGEKAFQAINRICTNRGMLPLSTVDGHMRLWNSEPPGGNHPLIDTASAISRQYVDDVSDRFSEYLTACTGTGQKADAFASAVARDTGITDYRPFVVVCDAPGPQLAADLRAVWEANVRHARGERLTYAFASAVDAQGRTYLPGERYRVVDSLFGLDTVMMVRSAALSVNENEITTKVDLCRPTAFQKQVQDPQKLVKGSKRPRRRRRR